MTRSGTNRYQGQIGTYYQTDAFYGDRRPFVRFNPFDSNVAETGLLNPDDEWTYVSPLGDIGGPIIKDRLWFYGGAAYTKNEMARDATFRTDVTKTNRHFDWWSDSKYCNST